jgi:hypothetical protein
MDVCEWADWSAMTDGDIFVQKGVLVWILHTDGQSHAVT